MFRYEVFRIITLNILLNVYILGKSKRLIFFSRGIFGIFLVGCRWDIPLPPDLRCAGQQLAMDLLHHHDHLGCLLRHEPHSWCAQWVSWALFSFFSFIIGRFELSSHYISYWGVCEGLAGEGRMNLILGVLSGWVGAFFVNIETFVTILIIQNSHFLINSNNFIRKWARIS